MSRRIGAADTKVKCVKCGKVFEIRVRGGDYGFVLVCAACVRAEMMGKIKGPVAHG